MLKFTTAGESHGDYLVGILEGLPANIEIDMDYINFHMERRQKGYGRGARMRLERDRVCIGSGVNDGYSTGSPISILLKNRGNNIELKEVYRPRPGHADLPGLIKYNQRGGRNILERASARETAMRVALGSIARLFLKEFDINIYSHVIQIGSIKTSKNYYTYNVLKDMEKALNSEMNTIDKDIERKYIEEIQKIEMKQDSIGGKIEIVVENVPVGLGSHISWDRKLDGILAQAIMSIPAIKGVEFGLGFDGTEVSGSSYHDEIYYNKGFNRRSNHAGGIEGGISNGEDLVIKMVMKPIPTLKLGLETVDIRTKKRAEALVERSDTSAVSAASVVGESMVGLVLARVFLEKFGGDSLEEVARNYDNYLKKIK